MCGVLLSIKFRHSAITITARNKMDIAIVFIIVFVIFVILMVAILVWRESLRSQFKAASESSYFIRRR